MWPRNPNLPLATAAAIAGGIAGGIAVMIAGIANHVAAAATAAAAVGEVVLVEIVAIAVVALEAMIAVDPEGTVEGAVGNLGMAGETAVAEMAENEVAASMPMTFHRWPECLSPKILFGM